MKKLALSLGALFILLFSFHAVSGESLRNMGNLDPGVTQSHSLAFGKSLNAWMEAYIRWLENGADPADRVKNAAFLPILGDSPFDVEVEPGTALVLPIVTWLGFPGDDALPNEWWGNPDHIFGDVYLDGRPVAVPNLEYYVGPTALVPPASLFGFEIIFYQALVVVINPLTPGQHVIELHSEFVDFGVTFDNIWNVTVRTPTQK